MPLVRSLMYIKKNKGSKIEPFWTPASTRVQAEVWLFSTTLWSLFFRKLWISSSGNIWSYRWVFHVIPCQRLLKKTALTSRGGLQSNDIMHIFCELWREANIYMNHMVKNWTDFQKPSYFSGDIQKLNWTKFSQKFFQE